MIEQLAKSTVESFEKINLVIFDVDGIFTKGTLYYSNKQESIKRFNVYDGLGIKNLLKSNIEVAIISSRESKIVTNRCLNLGIKPELIYQGSHNKRENFEHVISTTKHNPDNIAYVGDDLPDLPVMKKVGSPISVANANEYVKSKAIYVTHKKGGNGAIREISDLILQSQNKLQDIINYYENL